MSAARKSGKSSVRKRGIVIRKKEKSVPKYRTMPQVALRLRQDQIEFLGVLEAKVSANRDVQGIEAIDFYTGEEVCIDRRVTKNTFIRCLIDRFKELYSQNPQKLDLKQVLNEDDLANRLKKIL
jgi:hypothetical protein